MSYGTDASGRKKRISIVLVGLGLMVFQVYLAIDNGFSHEITQLGKTLFGIYFSFMLLLYGAGKVTESGLVVGTLIGSITITVPIFINTYSSIYGTIVAISLIGLLYTVFK